MQVEEGRKGPALCAPSLSKTSHPQAYRTFSAYFLAVWCPLSSIHTIKAPKSRNIILTSPSDTIKD
eukprot:scaffold38111_cov55-Cyclotella_meneghiniana.AAC.3